MAEYQSKAMRDLAAAKAKKQSAYETSVKKALDEFKRTKETVEKLSGERGDNPAIRRNDLKPIASIKLKSARSPGDVNALQEDVKALHDALVRLSNIYGTAGR